MKLVSKWLSALIATGPKSSSVLPLFTSSHRERALRRILAAAHGCDPRFIERGPASTLPCGNLRPAAVMAGPLAPKSGAQSPPSASRDLSVPPAGGADRATTA